MIIIKKITRFEIGLILILLIYLVQYLTNGIVFSGKAFRYYKIPYYIYLIPAVFIIKGLREYILIAGEKNKEKYDK